MKPLFVVLVVSFSIAGLAFSNACIGQPPRWHLADDGGIFWSVGKAAGYPEQAHADRVDAHADHIEMSGKRIAIIVTYGVDSLGRLELKKKMIFPALRTIPNDTRGSLSEGFEDNIINLVTVDGRKLEETPYSFYIKGYLRILSRTNSAVCIQRTIYPSVDKPAYFEEYRVSNAGSAPVDLKIPAVDSVRKTDVAKGVYGSYLIQYRSYDAGTVRLPAGASYCFSLVISGQKATEDPYYYSAVYEYARRIEFVGNVTNSLVLKTPNDTINRMFSFAKIRTTESIYDTKAGLMHGPGGGDYYAAIWANDQAEYVDPFFPFLGNAAGNESARNSFRLFAGYMNPLYNPIPSSIIAEGTSFWNGAGDRGDQAMIAYGASRFALALGDTLEAERLYPLITWCLEYLTRKKTAEGVISSTSDELEGRFPAGAINLSTNVLAYGGFLYAARLADQLGNRQDGERWKEEALRLDGAIEKYFGAKVQGFDTYRYYEGNTVLRSWICLPLVMGIFNRKQQTIKALLSPFLWTHNGILTAAGSATFWDRATLYAFRGLFYAGETDTSVKYFNDYSRTRLLGEHVPYAVEAWPEGDQRHLSAESGLYCRVVTEGLFGIDPLGFHTFTIMPRLPRGWKEMSLDHVKAFDRDFAIAVQAAGDKERVVITSGGKKVKEVFWNGQSPITVTL